MTMATTMAAEDNDSEVDGDGAAGDMEMARRVMTMTTTLYRM